MEALIPILVLGALFWVLILAPQRRRQRAHAAMQDEVGVGDEIITAGGVHGEVVHDEGETVRVEIAPGVIVRLDRRAVAAVARDVDDEDEEADEEPDEDELSAEAEEPAEAR